MIKPKRGMIDMDDVQDIHYRMAESQFLRMLGGTGGAITQVEYFVDPQLERQFDAKRREYDKSMAWGSTRPGLRSMGLDQSTLTRS